MASIFMLESNFMELKPYFENIKKGTVKFNDSGDVTWELGELVLTFYDDRYECTCSIARKTKHKWHQEITHMHLDESDLKEFINDVDSPEKKLCVHKILNGVFGVVTSIVPADENKKFRIYSI